MPNIDREKKVSFARGVTTDLSHVSDTSRSCCVDSKFPIKHTSNRGRKSTNSAVRAVGDCL